MIEEVMPVTKEEREDYFDPEILISKENKEKEFCKLCEGELDNRGFCKSCNDAIEGTIKDRKRYEEGVKK